MSKTSKFPCQQIRKDLESVRVASDDLYALSQHFFAIGNEHVGSKLQSMADALNNAQEGIDESVRIWILQDFNYAREASVNMIKGIMAGRMDD